MPPCEYCEGNKFFVIDNYDTCTTCGNQREYTPVFTFSYSHMCTSRPKAYYCRTKRFQTFVMNQRSHELNEAISKILDLYTLVEFHWSIEKQGRKYFFSRKVILYFIVSELGLDVEVPLLKDKERTALQLTGISNLVAGAKARNMYLI